MRRAIVVRVGALAVTLSLIGWGGRLLETPCGVSGMTGRLRDPGKRAGARRGAVAVSLVPGCPHGEREAVSDVPAEPHGRVLAVSEVPGCGCRTPPLGTRGVGYVGASGPGRATTRGGVADGVAFGGVGGGVVVDGDAGVGVGVAAGAAGSFTMIVGVSGCCAGGTGGAVPPFTASWPDAT